jgi:hypothetical protein
MTLKVPQARVLLFNVFISASLAVVDFVGALGATRPALSCDSCLIMRGGEVVVSVSCCLKNLLAILGTALKASEFHVFRLKMIMFLSRSAKVFIVVLNRTMINFVCRGNMV